MNADYIQQDTRKMIEICLNCTQISCQYGTCEKLRREEHTRRMCAKPGTRLYTMDGETHPLSFWALLYGITTAALHSRLKSNGGDLKSALNFKRKGYPSKSYTCFGETHTTMEWAALCGKEPACIRWRLAAGWPYEKAFAEAEKQIQKGKKE